MPKNPNSSTKPVKREGPMNATMKFFLAGCVAELYLLVVRKYYINGTLTQVIAWDSYLRYILWTGVAILAIGVILSIVWHKDRKKRVIGWSVGGAGAFLAFSSWFTLGYVDAALRLMCVVVPVVMLLDILWSLVTALIGAYLLASGFEGFFFRWSLKWFERPLMILGAVMLIVPGMVTDLVGIAIIVVEFVTEFMFKRSEKFVPVTVSQSTT